MLQVLLGRDEHSPIQNAAQLSKHILQNMFITGASSLSLGQT